LKDSCPETSTGHLERSKVKPHLTTQRNSLGLIMRLKNNMKKKETLKLLEKNPWDNE
jgi:hypothetical protein